MRLDKYLCDALGISRKEALKVIKDKAVTINEVIVTEKQRHVPNEAIVGLYGESVTLSGPCYIMLNKPSGYVCSHEDEASHASAFVLLEHHNVKKLHFAGRLDADTTGLVLITDDGQWSHKITSPKHVCQKRYRVWLADPIEDDYEARLLEGIQLNGEKSLTKPAQMDICDKSNNELLLTITEGKYHQVKRMFAALGNKVIKLHREQIGQIVLDPQLEPGEYRFLESAEIHSI